MTGKHVCKPENQPQIGQVKNLIVLGDKIKNKKPDEGGQPYRIVSVTPDPTYSDNYNNVAFHIEIEPETGQQSTQAAPQQTVRPFPSDDRGNRIERQHSQEMAIRWITLLTTLGVMPPEDVKTPKKLRETIDFFHRDVARLPSSTTTTEPEPDPAEGEEVF